MPFVFERPDILLNHAYTIQPTLILFKQVLRSSFNFNWAYKRFPEHGQGILEMTVTTL